MKYPALLFLKFYKAILSPLLHQVLGVSHACRYSPTCSEFATIHIAKEGLVVGGWKSFCRLLYCQPFAKSLPQSLQN